MKLLKNIFALIMIVSLASCSSDDDNNTSYGLTLENFVDTYSQFFSKNIVAETVTFSNGTSSTTTTTTDGIIFQDVNYTFNNGGTFVANGLLTTRITIVSASGETTVVDDIIVSLDINGTYSLNTTNSTLNLSYQLEGQNITKLYDITRFTETELYLEYENEVTVGDITTNTFEELRFNK